jgi:CarD family transcriptional regulator
MSNAAAAQALMASATASKEAAARNAAKAAADKAAAEAAAAAPPPPVQTISPPIAQRPGMSRPGMPGMRPAFSITPRMPMGALRSGGMAEAQAGAPKAPPVKVDFRTGDMVVYPTHGVGTVQGIEDVNVAGISLQVITVTFEENRMTLRVPTNKAASAGLRKLAGPALVKLALDTLKGRARIKRTMWSRRTTARTSGSPRTLSRSWRARWATTTCP